MTVLADKRQRVHFRERHRQASVVSCSPHACGAWLQHLGHRGHRIRKLRRYGIDLRSLIRFMFVWIPIRMTLITTYHAEGSVGKNVGS